MPIKETGHWRAFTILRLIGHKLFGRYPFINLPLFPLKTRLSITSDRVYSWSVNLKSKRCCCVHNTCWDEDKDWNTGNLVLLCIFHTLEKFTTCVDWFVFFLSGFNDFDWDLMVDAKKNLQPISIPTAFSNCNGMFRTLKHGLSN